MILIARAMVKSPWLLILDEPMHGLDARNRQKLLHLIENIVVSSETHIILVTHIEHEIPSCIDKVLRLG